VAPADASGIAFIGLHVVLLVGLLGGVRWLGRQRAMGYPDRRARAIDRPAILAVNGTGYVVANLVLLVCVAIAFDIDLFPRPGLP
jgi:hypothetical protein